MNWRSVLSIIACTTIAQSQSVQHDFRHIAVDETITFPRDHGAHPDTQTEWWYLTGQFEDAAGRPFGLQFTIFRSALTGAPRTADESPLRARQAYLGHFALADINANELRFAERVRRGGTALAIASETDMDLQLDDWTFQRGAGDRFTLTAADPTIRLRIELELSPQKPIVLHGADGISAKGAEQGNASVYTSYTRLAARGELSLDGKLHTILGSCWFDHEYGTSVLGKDVRGWDWFGLQLDDGRELMLFYLRHEDGSAQPASAGTLIASDGATTHLSREDFTINASGAWKSPHTAATYPNVWRVQIPQQAIDLTLEPSIDDCEIGSKSKSGVTYWEGPVRISGSQTGRGYAELTGYAGSMKGRF